ncbi:hypothetical protein PoHVEF18_007216 [Penicillium ochrochloron]
MPAQKVITGDTDRKDFSGALICVEVGPDKEAFSVHERLIRNSSASFERALKDPREQSLVRTARLRKEEPEVFKAYIHWLYRDTIPIPHHDADDFEFDYKNDHGNFPLVKAYVLGDRLLDINFQNAVINAIWEQYRNKDFEADFDRWIEGNEKEKKCACTPSSVSITYAYINTIESSPLRRLLVDILVYDGDYDCLEGDPGRFPKGFLLDLTSQLIHRIRANKTRIPIQTTDYHIRSQSHDVQS